MRDIYETKNRRIFLFITSRCKRSCKYCFMKNNNYNCDMPDVIRKTSLEYAKNNNYHNVTLIGGEPLLCNNILDYVDDVISSGLSCSISTAGTEDNTLLKELFAKNLDDITISLDSADEKINDSLRGKDAFKIAVNTIETALNSGINVRVTTTVNKLNKDYIQDLIYYLQGLGVFQIDFHMMSYNGGAKEHQNLGLAPKEWVQLRSDIQALSFSNIALSIPYIWVENNSELHNQYCKHCEMQNCDRLSIMPNGDCYTCTLAIGEELPCGNIMNEPPSSININGIFDSHYICRCENQIGTLTSDQYTYLCRFIKQKIVK